MWGSSSDRFYVFCFVRQLVVGCTATTHDLDGLVVLGTLVGLEVVLELRGVAGNVGTAGRVEVVDHAVVEGEEGGRRTNLGTHVADRGHTRARERLDTRTSVLDDSTSAALDSEDTSDLQDDV